MGEDKIVGYDCVDDPVLTIRKAVWTVVELSTVKTSGSFQNGIQKDKGFQERIASLLLKL